MARQSLSASHGPRVDGMNDNRHIKLFGFSVERPERWIVEVFVINARVADRGMETQFAHSSIQFRGGKLRILQRQGREADELARMFFQDPADSIVVRAANRSEERRVGKECGTRW